MNAIPIQHHQLRAVSPQARQRVPGQQIIHSQAPRPQTLIPVHQQPNMIAKIPHISPHDIIHSPVQQLTAPNLKPIPKVQVFIPPEGKSTKSKVQAIKLVHAPPPPQQQPQIVKTEPVPPQPVLVPQKTAIVVPAPAPQPQVVEVQSVAPPPPVIVAQPQPVSNMKNSSILMVDDEERYRKYAAGMTGYGRNKNGVWRKNINHSYHKRMDKGLKPSIIGMKRNSDEYRNDPFCTLI